MGINCPKCHFENPNDTIYFGKCATHLKSFEEISAFHTETLDIPKDELTAGSTFARRYQIIEELGKGGVGKVYRAVDKKLDEEVALKLIEGDSALSIALKHKTEIPTDPGEFSAQIPEELSTVILKCMEKEKEKRYQNIGEVFSALDKVKKKKLCNLYKIGLFHILPQAFIPFWE